MSKDEREALTPVMLSEAKHLGDVWQTLRFAQG